MNNILIIEDEEKVVNVLKGYLEREGYKVYSATNGTEGLKLFDSNEFDILYLLAVNKRRAFSREHLIEKVFGIDFEGFDKTIDVQIYQ